MKRRGTSKQRHDTRPVRVKRRPSDRLRVRVAGDVYTSAAQVRAELDRAEIRMRALKRDMARQLPPGDDLRREYNEFYSRWYEFRRQAREDWLAWGANVTQAQYFDQEADAYRRRLVERGFTATSPTRPTTVNRASGDWGSFLGKAALAVGLIIGGGLAVTAVAARR